MDRKFELFKKLIDGHQYLLPPGKHPIGYKRVYKIIYQANGATDRYKARLVAERCTQQGGLDFFENLSTVAKLITI